MSVVFKREHPSGEIAVSVAAFPDEQEVVVGVGNLRDMSYFAMTQTEAFELANTIDKAAISVSADSFIKAAFGAYAKEEENKWVN